MQRDDPRLLQDLVPNELATWPWPCKRYADGLPVTALPRAWPPAPPALAVLAGSAGAPALDLAGLARMLHLSAGVVRVAELEDRPAILFRAAGSAGGRFPLELYVAARGVDGPRRRRALVRPGRSRARPGRAGGRERRDDAGRDRASPGGRAGATPSAATATCSGTRGRCSRKRSRSPRPRARLWTRFPDAAVARLVGADMPHELPLALVALEAGEPAVAAGGEAVAGRRRRRARASCRS